MDPKEIDLILKPPDQFEFPFPPYEIQKDFMKTLYETLELGQLGIFESPTGTGKSLSIACASLQWLKDHEERKVKSLIKKIEQINIKKDEVSVKEDDWINEQYQIKLYNDEICKVEQKLNDIETYKDRMNKIKHKKKKARSVNSHNIIDKKSTQNVSDDLELDEDEYILDDTESVVEDDLQDEKLKNTQTQIIFASRTHSQLSQIVAEISKSPHSDIRVVTLASRQSYCLNSSVRALKHNTAINEKCLDLQKGKSSETTRADEFQKPIKKKKVRTEKCCAFKNSNNVSELTDFILSDIVDVEDLIKEGKSLNACPYYASRNALEDAQFIAVPYQTLLSKRTREISGINIENNVIIIDEAHNLLDTITNIHSSIFTFEQATLALAILRAYQKKYGIRLSDRNYLLLSQLIFVTKQIVKITDKIESSIMYTTIEFVLFGEFENINLLPIVNFCDSNNFVQKVAGYARHYSDEINNLDKIVDKKLTTGVKALLKQIQDNKSKKSTDIVEKENIPSDKSKDSTLSPVSCLYALQAFLTSLTEKYEDGKVLVSKVSDPSRCFIKYLVLNPRIHFQDLVKKARSVIVAGGTMQPFDDFSLQLFGTEEITRVNIFSCGHVVPEESLCPIIMTKGPSGKDLLFNYSNRCSAELMQDLSMIIQNICSLVPGGIVCFFPSYEYEQQVYDSFKKNQTIDNIVKRKLIFREPKKSGEVDSILQNYSKCIKQAKNKKSNITGALMLGVVGGKISEGLNFSDDLGRCVIVVGVPYPNKTSLELKEKISFLNTHFKNKAGDIYYENLCFKAVNQCIGRAIRHINDYAAIVLVDERYAQPTNYKKLSNWIQSSLKMPSNFGQTFALLRNFFNQKKCDN